jgi:hypothetical protein
MLGTYGDAHALSWPGVLPRRRRRQVALSPTGRQAVRHGIRGAIQATCLSAAVLAASGLLGASHGPVVLSEPSQQPLSVHVAAPAQHAVDMASNVTTR